MGRTRTMAILLPLPLLAGCAIANPALEPPTPRVAVPESWQEPDQGVSIDVANYWTRLNDPLVDRFVAQAITANRNLAAASARVAQARAGVRAARASYLPTVSGSASTRRDIGAGTDDRLLFSLGADVQWEADLFGQLSGNVAASRADLAAAGYGLADLQRLIVGQIAQTVISARALATQLSIARETLGVQDENLQIARWRLQAGLVSSLDVEQARTQRAQTAATIPALERDLAQAANTISTLIGEAPGPVLAALQASPLPVPTPPDLAMIDPPPQVLLRRPDVRQAEASLIADSARVGVARAQLLPLLRLSGGAGTSSLGIGNLFDLVTGNIVASISQLIFDGGRTRAQIAGAQASAQASLAVWEQAILQSLEEVESARAAQRAARERVAIYNVAMDAANNAALLARSQYQAGLIDFQTLLTAENQLLTARNALVASEAEKATAFVRLTQALGGGWDATSFDPENPDGDKIPGGDRGTAE